MNIQVMKSRIYRFFLSLFIITTTWLIILFIKYDGQPEAYIGILNKAAAFSRGSDQRSDSQCCLNFPREASSGYWRQKLDLTDDQILQREEMDKRIRILNNWPVNLFRNDARCGKNFSIPGYRIQGLCDPKSSTPCCNTKTGECGISAGHCSCPECTDLRDMKSAELLEWVPDNPACLIRNFSTEEACRLLNSHGIHLAFIGDSLIRQLSTTMLLLLSGNFQSGAIPVNTTQSNREKCVGEFQITHRDCSIDVVAHAIHELPFNSICNGKRMFQIDCIQDYGVRLQMEVINKTIEMLGQNNTYIIMGFGMHYHLRSEHVINELNRFLDFINRKGNGWPKVIWIEIHSLNGFLRMESKFHNDRIDNFNTKVNEFLELRNVTVLRTFNVSKDLNSYDGQHYGIGFNLHKINMILSYLEKKYRRC